MTTQTPIVETARLSFELVPIADSTEPETEVVFVCG